MPESTEKPKKPPKFYIIPANKAAGSCRSCNQKVYWITTESGASMPISVAHIEALNPTVLADGRGISHFADCPHAATPRRAK